MKFPIDAVTADAFFGHLVAHERAQRQMVQALTELLKEAIESAEMASEDGEAPDWHYEAVKLLEIQAKIKMENETRLFNEKNGHGTPISTLLTPEVAKTDYSGVKLSPQQITDPELNQQIANAESGFGGELSEAELARMFREGTKKAPAKKQTLKTMSKEEINRLPVHELQKLVIEAEEEEFRQDNSNDLYKIKGRVQNLAVGISGGNLTAVGEMMVNSFVHVVKDLYDFADTLQDKETRAKLYERIKKHESMPGTLIAAAAGGVKVKK